jgi:hypothetical protein
MTGFGRTRLTRGRKRLVLSAVGAVLVVAATGFAASPAFAATGFLNATSATWIVGGFGAPDQTGELQLFGGGPLTAPTLTVDLSTLDGVASATFGAGCTVTSDVATCIGPDVTGSDDSLDVDIPATLTPLAGATGGTKVSLPTTVSAPGIDPIGGTVDITFVDGPDLNAVNPPTHAAVNLGDSVAEEPIITNYGDQAANGLILDFFVAHGIDPGSYDNCQYAPWPEDLGTFVACDVTGDIAPGASVVVDGFQGTIRSDSAKFTRSDMAYDPAGAPRNLFPAGTTFAPRPTSGHQLTIGSAPAGQSAPSTVLENPREITWGYNLDTNSDISVAGATLTGAVGDSISVTVKETNNGPAELDSFSSHEPVADLEVVIPAGATATMPSDCREFSDFIGTGPAPAAGLAMYECFSSDKYTLAVGETFSWTFTLKVSGAAGAPGEIALLRGVADLDATNDVSAITLTVPGAGPTPSGSASASPSASASGGSPTPSSSGPSGSGGGASSTTSAAAGGSGLALTGSDAAMFGGIGAVLLAIGAALFVLARRRRAIDVS